MGFLTEIARISFAEAISKSTLVILLFRVKILSDRLFSARFIYKSGKVIVLIDSKAASRWRYFSISSQLTRQNIGIFGYNIGKFRHSLHIERQRHLLVKYRHGLKIIQLVITQVFSPPWSMFRQHCYYIAYIASHYVILKWALKHALANFPVEYPFSFHSFSS